MNVNYKATITVRMVDKFVYNTVLSQCFSPCGNYLVAGNTYGNVAIYNLQKILDPDDTELRPAGRKPIHHIDVGANRINSLASTEKFLITGTEGEIHGWSWPSVLQNNSILPEWTIQLPADRNALQKADINSIQIDKSEETLYAGCGDNNIYVFSLEDGKLIRKLDGHEDYIHNIDCLENQMASASEDGTVRMWDIRQSTCSSILKPHTKNSLTRPNLGKWIGSVALNEDWMVCGGGPRFSLWHLRTLEVTVVPEIPDLEGIHMVNFHEDRLLVGGCGPHFYQMNFKGKIIAQIPTSALTVYSAVIQETPHKVLSIAGSSYNIDVCTNFSYRDLVLSFAL